MQPQTTSEVRWEWIGEGWQMFAAQWQTWVLIMLAYLGVMLAVLAPIYALMVALIFNLPPEELQEGPPAAIFIFYPLIFGVMSVVLSYLMGGLFRTAFKQLRGETISVRDLFSGGDCFGKMLGAFVLLWIMGAIGLALCLIPALVVAGLFLFTLPLVAERGLGPLEALRTSMEKTKGNLLMFSLFAVVLYLIAAAGGMLCGVGALITYPVVFATMAVAYRDLFGLAGARRLAGNAPPPASAYAPPAWQQPPQPVMPPPFAPPQPQQPPFASPQPQQQSFAPPQQARPPLPQTPPEQASQQRTCPHCNTVLVRAAKFCNYCGKPIPA
jgi:hypothetical protein